MRRLDVVLVFVVGTLGACAPSIASASVDAGSPAAEPQSNDRRAVALAVPTQAKLPIYVPRNEMERVGVTAALHSLATLGEGGTVQLIVQAAPQLMNVGGAESERVRGLLTKRYQELGKDPLWTDMPSPLSSAFETTIPLMLVAPPRNPNVDAATAPVVVFLHGYGGNGKLFAWLLSRALPDAWVIAPSHGVSWARPDLGYLDEALERFEEHSRGRHGRYWLVGLSDGGVGSFEVLSARPKSFAGVVNIVGVPRTLTVPRLPRDVPMLWMNGKTDRFVSAAVVRERFARVDKRVDDATLLWFEGGHYFLIDDDAAALERVQAFVSGAASSKRFLGLTSSGIDAVTTR